MNFPSRHTQILSHIVALLTVTYFCMVNTFPTQVAPPLPETHDIFMALLQGSLFSVPLMLFPVIFTLFLPQGKNTLKTWFTKPAITLRGGLGCFIMLLFCSNALLTVLAPADEQPIVALFQCLKGWEIAIIASFICIFVPLAEELLFRGLLMRGLPTCVALIYSSVIFACAHGINLYVIPLFFTGWMLGLIRTRSASLIPSICCHAAFNTTSLLITLLL
jgi:membrane protease YdiL (CAAX protease family)